MLENSTDPRDKGKWEEEIYKLNSENADCVQSHGAFWQSNVVLPESETRDVEAVCKSAARCEDFELNLNFKIRKLNFNDPCRGISLVQRQN